MDRTESHWKNEDESEVGNLSMRIGLRIGEEDKDKDAESTIPLSEAISSSVLGGLHSWALS